MVAPVAVDVPTSDQTTELARRLPCPSVSATLCSKPLTPKGR